MTIRFLLLGAVSGAALLASPASAACVAGAGTLACTGLTDGPVDVDGYGTAVSIASGATLQADDGADALRIEADDVSITVDGTITTVVTPEGDDAVRLDGTGVTLANNIGGLIEGASNAITEQNEGENADFTLFNQGTIRGDADVVEVQSSGFSVTNTGTIESTGDGRALQGRGFGFTVDNQGTIRGIDEAVEGRDGFQLTNALGAVIASTTGDGVQYGDGTLVNHGLIDGGDDGVDVDSGLVRNFGAIIARGADGGGVDIDPEAEGGGVPGKLRIENHAGAAITGFVGILADPISRQPLEILNEGALTGIGGDAILMAPSQGSSTVQLSGGSVVDGDITLGGGDDTLLLGDFLIAGDLTSGGEIDGRDGIDAVTFLGYDFASLFDVAVNGGLLSFGFQSLSGETVTASLRNFEFAQFDDGRYEIRGNGLAAVPAPAAGLLLGGALFGLAALRRRT